MMSRFPTIGNPKTNPYETASLLIRRLKKFKSRQPSLSQPLAGSVLTSQSGRRDLNRLMHASKELKGSRRKRFLNGRQAVVSSHPSHPLRWFPEFWELSRKRLRPQARLLGLSLVVGVVAGLGAIVFFVACQVVVHFALDAVAGYHPHAPGRRAGPVRRKRRSRSGPGCC